MKITLTNPTDDELSAAVAEHVDGWRYVGMAATIGCDPRMWAKGTPGASDYIMSRQDQFHYATSADAVLPLLEKCRHWRAQQWEPSVVYVDLDAPEYGEGVADTFPRAACIALLRANGVEVVFTGKVEA